MVGLPQRFPFALQEEAKEVGMEKLVGLEGTCLARGPIPDPLIGFPEHPRSDRRAQSQE